MKLPVRVVMRKKETGEYYLGHFFLHGKNTTKTARIRYQLMMHTLMKTAQKGKKPQPTNVV
jgi:hypothetical protein